jgi:membrane-associated protease RseP (regulator of RpoE activity)
VSTSPRNYETYDPTKLSRHGELQTKSLSTRDGKITRRNAVSAAVAAAAATAASSSPILSSLLSSLGSILILAIVILVHEGGHYLAAKQFGITVEEFSIGFGPKLISSTLGPDNDEFNVRLIPLGGYVRFPENYNTTLAREIQQYEMNEAEEFIRQRQPNLVEQILNALSLGIIEDQKWQSEKQRRIQEIRNKNQQKQTQNVLRPWWKRFTQIAPVKLSSSSSESSTTIDLATELEYYDDPTLLQNRPWIERAIVLSGGVIFNLILAFILYFGQINLGPGLPVPIFDNGIVISANPRPDAAASGLLRQGDIIVKVNGVDVMSNVQSSSSSSSPSAISSQQAISEFIARIRATKEGDTLALSVVHPSQTLASAMDEENGVNLSPNAQDILVRPKRSNNGSGPMTIGVLLSPNYKQTNLIRTNNPFEAANLAVQYVSTLTQETADGIMALVRALVLGIIGGSSSSNGIAANSVAGQVSGPLGLLRTGSEVVSSQDITSIVLFTSAISINLAVINGLPFPALDGGQLVFVLSEAITGRKVNQRFQENLTAVAVLFLLLVSLSTFVGDLNAVFGK